MYIAAWRIFSQKEKKITYIKQPIVNFKSVEDWVCVRVMCTKTISHTRRKWEVIVDFSTILCQKQDFYNH
jgi:hypothetical protein